MLYHTTWLISKVDPLRYICNKPYLSSRIVRWQVLLSEYDIVYMTKKAVKGTQKVVKRFIEKDLICRYGPPEKIVTDNA
jgi:hypothetical protein